MSIAPPTGDDGSDDGSYGLYKPPMDQKPAVTFGGEINPASVSPRASAGVGHTPAASKGLAPAEDLMLVANDRSAPAPTATGLISTQLVDRWNNGGEELGTQPSHESSHESSHEPEPEPEPEPHLQPRARLDGWNTGDDNLDNDVPRLPSAAAAE
eukprot:COSAG05_NODE_11006_length_535_cov_0.701835_1_plen_154_part_01